MMKRLVLTALALAAIGNPSGIAPSNATPPCQTNWVLESDGQCHPIYSTPINGYDPSDPSGDGFLRGFGPDSSWQSGGPAQRSTGSSADRTGSLKETDIQYINTLQSIGMTIGANRASYDRIIEQGHAICADLKEGAPADDEADYIYHHMRGSEITQSQATGWVHTASVSYCPGLG